MTANSSKRPVVCIVCHDAGGAEILASYVVRHDVDARLALAGPAVAVFRRRLGKVVVLPLAEAIAAGDWCLLGTSWEADLEWEAIGAAARAGKHCVAFLDHWVNYHERFVRAGELRLPDELWVGDEDAERLAREQFPGLPVTRVPNPYFLHLADEFAACAPRRVRRGNDAWHALFICENVSGHARIRFGDERYWCYTEFEALEYFFGRLGDLGAPIERVVLRPHPSDPPGKYDGVVAQHATLARLGGRAPLTQEIVDADIVAGCESVALVAAGLAGRRVLCCVPPGGVVQYMDRRRGVEMLRDLPRARIATRSSGV